MITKSPCLVLHVVSSNRLEAWDITNVVFYSAFSNLMTFSLFDNCGRGPVSM
jgi:hypothetical protein